MARNFIDEIKSINSRKGNYYKLDLDSRMRFLSSSLNDNGKFNDSSFKYFPVTIVAYAETFFNSIIEELIDSGEPYLSAASDLNEAKQIKYDSIKSLIGKEVSVGQIIAHLCSYSKFEQIDSNFKKLLIKEKNNRGLNTRLKDFLDKELQTTEVGMTTKIVDVLADSIEGIDPNILGLNFTSSAPAVLINIVNENWDNIKKDLTELFKIRHIICHELDLKRSKEEIFRICKNSILYLKICKMYFEKEVFKTPSIESSLEAIIKRREYCLSEYENYINDIRESYGDDVAIELEEIAETLIKLNNKLITFKISKLNSASFEFEEIINNINESNFFKTGLEVILLGKERFGMENL